MNNSEQQAVATVEGFALSPQQTRTWTAWHRAGDGPGCHAIAATLRGVTPAQAAQRLRMLIEAQEILRSRFVRHAQLREPVQLPVPYHADLLQLRQIDAARLDGQVLEQYRRAIWEQALATRIECGVLAWCATLADGALYLVVAAAPLAADARTLVRLLRTAQGGISGHAADALQYPDVTAWLLQCAEDEQGEEGESARAFWRRQDAANGARIGLDTGAVPAGLPRRATRPLDQSLLDALAARAARHGVRQDDLAFASWLWMLRTLCADDVLPPSARLADGVSTPELEDVFGPLERMLPLALAAGCAPLSGAGLAQVGAACDAMRAYQECYRADERADALRYAFRWLDARGLGGTVDALAACGERFRAMGGVLLQEGGHALTLDYHPGLTSDAGAACLLEQWECLLEQLAADPAEPSALRIGANLQRRILALGSGPERPLKPGQTVLGWMERRLAADGGGLVVDGAALPLAALDARANRLARRLLAEGVGKGALVGLHLPRSHDYVVAMLAVLKTGAAYLPMDVDYPHERLAYMAGQAEPALIIHAGAHGAPAFGAVPCAPLAALEAGAVGLADSAPGIALDGEDTAYVLYTSGSSGTPKGVEICHGALVNHMRWMIGQFGFSGRDVFLQRTSASFDASVWEFWAPLMLGATMVIARQDKTYDLAHLIGLIERERVSVAQFVPSLLDTLVEYPAFTGIGSLRHLLVGGEALGAGLRRRVCGRMQVRLTNLYGPTEACIDATFEDCMPDGAAGSIGRPIDNTRVCVLDRAGQLAGIGVAGELCIAGAGLFKGYLKRPDLTAQQVLAAPYSGERCYRTGDLARLHPDGSIEYLGRIDQQVKLHGLRIELDEINAVLLQAGARTATVVCDGTLVSFAATPGVDGAALLAHARRHLPAYMVPARIVATDALPLLPNGKLDLAALRSLAAQEQAGADGQDDAPRSPTEQLLAGIWAKVLRREQVGAEQRFFAIGGDSIRSIQLVYEAGRQGLAFSVMNVFEFQTVRALAAHLDSGAAAPAAAALQRYPNPAPAALLERHADAYPATEMQRYMIERYAADQAGAGVFHAQQAFMLTKPGLDRAALVQALAYAADAANFRTRFVLDGAECYQVLGASAVAPVELIDLCGMGEEQQRAALRAGMDADRAQRFDPFDPRGTLLRIRLYLLGPDRVEVALSNHHAVQDGWGNVEFMNRVGERYRQLTGAPGDASDAGRARGGANVCKEFALMQHALVRDPAQSAFWRAQADSFGAPPALLAQADGRAYLSESIALPAALAEGVDRLRRAHNLSAKAIFLSAWLGALRALGLDQPVVGVVTNGRSEQLSDPFHAMGLFWNLLPLAAELPSGDGAARCAAMQERLLALEPYARFPLRCIEQLAGRTGLLAAAFNFVNFHNQQQGEGEGSLQGTHVLDNFGVPLSLTVGVNGERDIALLLQRDAGLGRHGAALGRLLLSELNGLVAAQPPSTH